MSGLFAFITFRHTNSTVENKKIVLALFDVYF